MTAEELRQRLYQKPFMPFRVRLKDGRFFDISDPIMNLVAESVFIIGIPAPDDPRWADRQEWVDLALIEGLENPLETSTPTGS